MMHSAAKPVFIWEPKACDGNTLVFTVCIEMNILETSLDEGHLYFH